MDRILHLTLVHWHSIPHRRLPPTTPPQSTLFPTPRKPIHPTSIALGHRLAVPAKEYFCIGLRRAKRVKSSEEDD